MFNSKHAQFDICVTFRRRSKAVVEYLDLMFKINNLRWKCSFEGQQHTGGNLGQKKWD
jgi:hypothetical protein